jgi:predicted transcriptional regulator
LQESPKRLSAGKKRGPAPLNPTKKQRDDVALYAAAGLSEPGIAAEIGVCQNTLRKHFAAELQAGREREIAANLRRLRKAADHGNVTAMKHLDAKFDLTPRKDLETRRRPPGKKEIAQIEAERRPDDGDWSQLLQ